MATRWSLYALTIAEFMYLADHAKLDYATTAQRFKDAGVRVDYGWRLRDSYGGFSAAAQ